MNIYLMKKAMIEAAIDRGIKEMENDPERSIRRLADLGRQFSKNRFQSTVFSVMQELLNNENSAYYDMVHNLLKNTDQEALKKFGVNFGYMSWTYGAAKLREQESQKKFCIPWTVLLRYDAESKDGLTMEHLASLMEQGQDVGIYAWFIRETGNAADSYELLTLLERYKECAYVWYRKVGRLTAAQIQMLKLCRNTVVALPLDDPETQLTAALLKDQKIPFALYSTYSRKPAEEKTAAYAELVLASEAAMFFTVAEDGAEFSAEKTAYDSRLEQNYPFVIMDYYGDGRAVSRVLCGHEELLEIGADGCVIRPDVRKGEQFDFDAPLLEALEKVMPRME
jgi:hypothetical protein